MVTETPTLPVSAARSPSAGAVCACDAPDCLAAASVSFDQIYEQYARPIYNFVLRSVRDAHAAEDVCQEIWIKVYRQLDSLRDPRTARAWLYRLAHRTCIDAARRRARMHESADILDESFAAEGEDPAAAAVQLDESRLLWQTLGALPPRQHTALFLREVEGYPYREIARILGTSESAVETLLFRARGAISRTYAGVEQDRRGRCHQAGQLIAALADGETTPIQARALQAHADECRACAHELAAARRTSAALVAVPLLPVPSMLMPRITAAVEALSHGGSHGIGTAIAHLLARTKTIAMSTATAGAITASVIIAPADQPGAMASNAASTIVVLPSRAGSLPAAQNEYELALNGASIEAAMPAQNATAPNGGAVAAADDARPNDTPPQTPASVTLSAGIGAPLPPVPLLGPAMQAGRNLLDQAVAGANALVTGTLNSAPALPASPSISGWSSPYTAPYIATPVAAAPSAAVGAASSASAAAAEAPLTQPGAPSATSTAAPAPQAPSGSLPGVR